MVMKIFHTTFQDATIMDKILLYLKRDEVAIMGFEIGKKVEEWKKIIKTAKRRGYDFLSYQDGCITYYVCLRCGFRVASYKDAKAHLDTHRNV